MQQPSCGGQRVATDGSLGSAGGGRTPGGALRRSRHLHAPASSCY
ncbi:hypothetical protein [Azospirillum palustre]